MHGLRNYLITAHYARIRHGETIALNQSRFAGQARVFNSAPAKIAML
jgi:hypothetical protein